MSQDKEGSNHYADLGVSADKKAVHIAVQDLPKGLFLDTFCKVFPSLTGQKNYGDVYSTDGTGTKSILPYLYFKETGDITPWYYIAIDAIAMNIGDLLCTGAVGPYHMEMSINRNPFLITDEMLNAIIAGAQNFCEKMAEHGIIIIYTGGETADLGDSVRTLTIDISMRSAIKLDQVVRFKAQPGTVVVGLASYGQATYEDKMNSGIGANGLTGARHDVLCSKYRLEYPEAWNPEIQDRSKVYSGNYSLAEFLQGATSGDQNIGQLLMSPTRVFAPVIRDIVTEVGIEDLHGLVLNTGGAHTKVLSLLPKGLTVVKDNLLPVPPVFKVIQQAGKMTGQEMYKTYNMGTFQEVYVHPGKWRLVVKIAQRYGIHAQAIGYVEASVPRDRPGTVRIKTGSEEYTYTKD